MRLNALEPHKCAFYTYIDAFLKVSGKTVTEALEPSFLYA